MLASESGKLMQVQVENEEEFTVLQLKEKIQSEFQIPSNEQRLIYSGKILKDPDHLSLYKMSTGHTIHLVRSRGSNSGSSSSSNTQTTTQTNTTPTTQTNTNTTNTIPQTTPQYPFMGMLNNSANSLDNPMAQMMQIMLSNPQMMESMLANNPMASQMGISADQYRQALQDPMFQSILSNPQLLSSIMQLSQQLPQQSHPSQQSQMTSSGLPPLPNPLLNNPLLMNPFTTTATTTSTTPTTNTTTPEVRFASQLQQLQEMGFYDASKNIRALLATAGNVNAAVEYLLSQL